MKELIKIVNKKQFILIFFLKLIGVISMYAVSFAYAKYITTPITLEKIKNLIISLIILYIISIIVNFFIQRINDMFLNNIKYNIELHYFNKIEDMEFSKLNDNHTGFINNLIEKTASSFQRVIGYSLDCYLPLVVGIISYVYMTLKQSLVLGLISLIIFFIAVVLRYIMIIDRETIRDSLRKKESIYNASYIDFASNILTVRKLHIEDFAKKKLNDESADFYGDLQIGEKKQANINCVFQLLIDIVMVIILLTVIQDVKNGVDALPYLIFYITIISKVTNSLTKITTSIEFTIRLKHDKKMLDDTIGILNKKTKSRFTKIKIENGIFSYKDNTKKMYFPDFEFKEGDKISIMGESGQGKSTVLNLLSGFYPLREGNLLINDKKENNNQIDPIFISQEVELFDLSIRDNLTLGKNISEEKIISLLEEVGLLEWYNKLPNGLDEKVGEKGIKLSAGQKQRLNIIRGILIDSPVYFFDEPTSNLDIETEDKVIKLIDKYLKDKSYIIVTHRPKLKELCNKHYVMENNTLSIKKAKNM